jgi:hypothetical protein
MTNPTSAELQQRVRELIREEQQLTCDEDILDHWFSLTFEEKMGLLEKALS